MSSKSIITFVIRSRWCAHFSFIHSFVCCCQVEPRLHPPPSPLRLRSKGKRRLSPQHVVISFEMRVSQSPSQAQHKTLKSALAVNQFPASKVYECLTSVPFNPAVGSRFLKYYKDSVQFQSTLAHLKAPPASYLQPPVDLLGGLDVIQTKIDTGAFANQYEFEATLQRLIYSAHDDHFDLASGILGVFAFGTSYRIVSVSEDGIELPKVYVAGMSATPRIPMQVLTLNSRHIPKPKRWQLLGAIPYSDTRRAGRDRLPDSICSRECNRRA